MPCYSVFHLLNCLDVSEEVTVVSLSFPSFFLLFFPFLFSFYSSLPLPFWNGMVMIGVIREVNHTHSFWDTFLTSCNKLPCIFRMFKGIFSCVNESAGIVVLPENIHNVEKLRWDFYTGELVAELIVEWLFWLKSEMIRYLKEQQLNSSTFNLLRYVDANDLFFF